MWRSIEKIGYVYRSCKGFERYGDYGHPSLVLYQVNFDTKSKEYYMHRDLLEIKGQVDKRNTLPYGFRYVINHTYDYQVKKAINFINAINVRVKDTFIKNIIYQLKRKRYPRFVYSEWLPGNQNLAKHYWIPWKYRNKVEEYMTALKADLIKPFV